MARVLLTRSRPPSTPAASSSVRGVTRPPQPVELANHVVRLAPATTADAAELFAAMDDERVWAAGYGGGPGGRWADVAAARDALAHAGIGRTGPRQAYVVRLAADSDLGPAGTVVGTSSLAEWDLENEGVHLGWTAYGPRWWGTSVNPACKLALLSHAFDDCGFGRVKLQTDLVNTRSQAAMLKLGATREGVVRRDIRRADGSWRDSVLFSILVDEWPAVRAGLEARISR
jgi:RimJ/RimL family protein N-acetyltransferase